jgi:hypothetical protein
VSTPELWQAPFHLRSPVGEDFMPEHFVELAKSNAYSDVTKRLDPEKVFQARARSLLAASSPGIERFAYNLLGPNLLGSLAFALDPYARFEVGTAIITPVNRTRRFQCVWPATRSIITTIPVHHALAATAALGSFLPTSTRVRHYLQMLQLRT